MKKSSLLVISFGVIATTEGFVVKRQAPARSRLSVFEYDTKSKHLDTKEENHLTYNPFQGYQSVDIDRAKDCAEHLGKCSMAEIKELKENLHKERVQIFASGGTPMATKDTLEHVALEEELELQLELLKDHDNAPDTHLFPEEMSKPLPHLMDNEPDQHGDGNPHHLHGPTPSQILAIEESVLEENTLETAMICLIMAAFILLPQMAKHF